MRYTNGLIDVLNYVFDNAYFHKFAVVSEHGDSGLKLIKENRKYVEQVKIGDFIEYIKRNQFNVIVLHSLRALPLSVLTSIPKEIRVVWFAWGFDIYSPIAYHPFIKIKDIYGPKTRRALYGSFNQQRHRLNSAIYRLWHNEGVKKAVHRIDFFSGVLPIEYEYIKKNSFFRAKPLRFNYFGLKSLFEEENINTPVCSGNNILIGNSGDPFNNHLDAFEHVCKFPLEGIDIHSFLSYGGTQEYKDVVIKKGCQLWGNRYKYHTDFMPFEEFNNIVLSCSNVIMFHERQQAMGNVCQSLWNGCKVFLSKSSVAYKSLTNSGYVVFSLQDDFNTDMLVKKLTDEQIKTNRNLLVRDSSLNANLTKIKIIINTLEEELAQK